MAAVAIVVCAALALAVLGLPLLLDGEEARAEGGVILARTPDGITVRCLGPEVSLTLDGFEGEVTFTNCFPNSTLTGIYTGYTAIGSNITCTVGTSASELKLSAQQKALFRFAVMGDSQGQNAILAEALERVGGCEFVIHLGDLTPSGQPSEFDELEATLRMADIPILTTPGNHDVKLDGDDEYVSRFGPTAFSFEYSGTTFAFVDSSDLVISYEEIDWLTEAFSDAERKVLVTHMPSYDPFGDNHTLGSESCDRIQGLILEEDIDASFAGHVHAYHLTKVEGTDMLISGGAGGTLVDGVHHLVIVTVDEDGFSYEKVDLGYAPPAGPQVNLIGKDGSCLNLTYEELMQTDLLESDSSYENQYWTVSGQGHYKGVLVRDLLDLVGGMVEGDLLTVKGSDGYVQEFGYLNAYPDAAWLSYQGEMIVALEMDGAAPPDWTEGPRLAMLPEDGLYSNSDCEMTSYEGQGFWVYESAGARWVKYVLTIMVEGPA